MMSKRVFRIWALPVVCAAFLVGSCSSDGDDGTGPAAVQPGQLAVAVTTSGTAGAAFQLLVTGADIANPVQVGATHRLYTAASGDTLRAAVIAQVSSGELLRFSVPDVNQASSYNVLLQEVAGSDNALLSTGSFSVSISQ